MGKNALMLQKNIVKNDSICDMLHYIFIVELQNLLIAPRKNINTDVTYHQFVSIMFIFLYLVRETDIRDVHLNYRAFIKLLKQLMLKVQKQK